MDAPALRCSRCQRVMMAEDHFCPSCGARAASPAPRVLARRRDREKLAGVCVGLADYFDLDATLVRAVYAVATFFTGVVPGIVLYVILALVLPAE